MGDLILIKNKLKKLREKNEEGDALPTQLYELTGLVSPTGKKVRPMMGFFVRNIMDDDIIGYAMDFSLNGWLISTLEGEMTERNLEFMLSIAPPSGGEIKCIEYFLNLSKKLFHFDPEYNYWEGVCRNRKREREVSCQTRLYVADASKIHF